MRTIGTVILGGLVVELAAAIAVLTLMPTPHDGAGSDAAAGSPPATGGAVYRIDIDRLAAMKPDLDPHFQVVVAPLATISQQAVDQLADGLKALVVTPPECLNTATNLNQTVGATVSTLNVSNDRFGFVLSAAQSVEPTAVPSPVLDACRDFTAVRPDGAVSETRVIAAPDVHDAIVNATHSIQTVDDAATGKTHAVDQYVYSARLDDHHLVTVTSFANPTDSREAGQQAQRLLTDAINAVRQPT